MARVLRPELRNEADDVRSRALDRVIGAFERGSFDLRTSEEFDGWVYTVVSRIALDLGSSMGAKRRDRRRESELGENESEELPAWVAGPVEEALRNEFHHELKRAIELLEEEQRVVVTLVLLDGYSLAATARKIGSTAKRINPVYWRAIAMLSMMLGDWNPRS